jgi:hypothetical protein
VLEKTLNNEYYNFIIFSPEQLASMKSEFKITNVTDMPKKGDYPYSED